MDLLNRITIKGRIILSFGLALLLFIVFTVFSIIEINELGELTSLLYQHPMKVSNAAIEAKTGVIRMHRSMKDLSMSRTQMDIHQAIQTTQSEEKFVCQNLDIVKNRILGKEGKELVHEVIELFAGWEPIRVEVELLTIKGDRKAAEHITRTRGADYAVRLERKMMELTSYATNKADGFMEEARVVQQRVLRNTIIFISATILLSLLIAYLITKSILSNVSTLKETMSEVTKTGILVKSEITGENEISDMALHFNRLVDRLQGQFWLKEGHASLGEEISGDLTYEDLVKKSINFISRYVDACAGAIYSYDEKRFVCELKASYAFVEGKYLSSEFGLGEGIVGQVAIEKKSILLKDIAAKDALGKTGTINEPPKNIYAIPLLYEKGLYGVLEVATFEEISPLKIEFLNIAAPIIATSLYTALQGMRIKNFLSSTQKANEELKAQAEELQSQTAEIHATSEELQEQNVELKLQKQQIEEANRLKSEFLSNMSHELRTPLNSVMALSRVLIRQAKDKLSEEELNYLKIIVRNGKNLLSLINDILDLAKIESGKMDVSSKLFSLSSAAETIMERLEPLAEDKGIKLNQEIPDDLPQIESDEIRVHQILQNLIGNAVKFTTKGSVTVSVRNDGENIHIEVVDTGIGIADKNLPHIFEEFRQVDGTTARQYEGTGLGLAIAYKAARMLGGDLSVESVLGKGSKFTLTLPIKPQGIIPEPESFVTGPSAEISSPQKTILVVDDEPEIVTMIADYLSQTGYFTITATSGAQALELAEKHRPFAITLDVIMPDMDGFEVLQHLKENPATKNIPTIIISISDDKEVGFALGAVGYITKPVNRDLLKEIKKILNDIGKPHKPPLSGELKTAKRVLVVEDNPASMIQLKTVLESEGYRVDIAGGGKEALDYVKGTIPDGIILDLMMPEVDGFAVLNNIRANMTTRNIPVLILTAKDLTSEDLKELKSNNVQQLVQKGDVPRETLLHKTRLMLGEASEIEPQKKLVSQEMPTGSLPKIARVEGKPTILLVEDNPDNMITIKAVLYDQYNIIEATDGEKGLDMALTERPDLILLDMSLPKMDGFTMVGKIKEENKTCHIPVIAMTARAMKGDREMILEAGCDDYISKPIDPDDTLKKIEGWMQKLS